MLWRVEAAGFEPVDEPYAPARPGLVDPDGGISPLAGDGGFDPSRHILLSLSIGTQPLLERALGEHPRAGAGNALTLMVRPAPAPEITRSDEIITAFLASGPWVSSLLEAGPCTATELCYRAVARALSCEEPGIALRVVEKEARADPPASVGEATIDVVVPHRGSDEHLRVALAGLARQTLPCRTILCFDQPPAPELVRELAAQDDLGIFEVSPSPAGPYVPRQHFGLASTARYVGFQDSDDFSLPSRLARMAAFAEAEGADVVGCQEVRCDDIVRVVVAIRYPLDVNHALNQDVGTVLLFPTTIMRSDMLRRLGGFSTRWRYAADYHFQLRAHWSARILNLDEFLYVRRRRASSLTTDEATGMRSPERQRITRSWDAAFLALKAGRSAAAEALHTIEYAGEDFTIRDLRTGSLSPASLRVRPDDSTIE